MNRNATIESDMRVTSGRRARASRDNGRTPVRDIADKSKSAVERRQRRRRAVAAWMRRAASGGRL